MKEDLFQVHESVIFFVLTFLETLKQIFQNLQKISENSLLLLNHGGMSVCSESYNHLTQLSSLIRVAHQCVYKDFQKKSQRFFSGFLKSVCLLVPKMSKTELIDIIKPNYRSFTCILVGNTIYLLLYHHQEVHSIMTLDHLQLVVPYQILNIHRDISVCLEHEVLQGYLTCLSYLQHLEQRNICPKIKLQSSSIHFATNPKCYHI